MAKPGPKPVPAHIRVLRKTEEDPDTGCITFTGLGRVNDRRGQGVYGIVSPDATGIGSGTRLVHRIVYEALVGPIPEDLTVDHLCDNKLCVSVEHLEVVTDEENRRRGNTKASSKLRDGLCRYGHDDWVQDGLNANGNPKWKCRTCDNARHRLRYRLGPAGLGQPGYKENPVDLTEYLKDPPEDEGGYTLF